MHGALTAGVDEAGRGPLAGPVVAAAVILDPARPIDGLADSKVLSPEQRERLAALIRERALAFAVGHADAAEIDAVNILQATLRAMLRAVAGLPLRPAHLRIDGNRLPRLAELPFRVTAEAIVRGDASCAEISAASILAKTVRDAQMRAYGNRFPKFSFAVHKGYPTRLHLEELRRWGPTELHRLSFGPVKSLSAAAEAAPQD